MTITPKRRKKLNQEQRKQQHHKYSNKKLMHKSDSMLFGQEGGATIRLNGPGYVNITSENSDDKEGYSDITVSLCAQNLSRMLLCNNVIEVVLKCPDSLISYDPNDTPICEIISAEKDHDNQADALGFAVYLESNDPDVQPVLVAMPYSDDTFNEINVMNEELKHRQLVNELSIAGIPNTTFKLSKSISSWSFNFNIKSIVDKKGGTISKFQDVIIDNETSETLKNVSRFLSFFPTNNKFILKFKNVKIKKKLEQLI